MSDDASQQDPTAVLIVPRDRKFNDLVAAFVAAATHLDLSVHSDSEGQHIRAVAW